MLQEILNEDWSDYDNRKITDHRDSNFFACSESWEVNYLINKIRKHYPIYTESQIKNAIAACCNAIAAPRPRKQFVECVMHRLKS